MSERKVLNKYYPPDFDPAAIPRRRVPRDQQVKVRLMTPFSMRCETCGDYIYKGKKFNARKEVAEGENYLGIKIFRFYIKCPKCAAEITFKTDPKNSDYLAEHGAVRNFEPWREDQVAGEEEKQEREAEEENDPMKALENRTLDSKREMDILDALDEIRTRNARNERLNAALQGHQIPGGEGSVAAAAAAAALEAGEDPEALAFRLAAEEDEKLAAAIFHTADGDGHRVKRLADDEEFKFPSAAASAAVAPAFGAPSAQARKRKAAALGNGKLGGIIIKKKKPAPLAPPAPPAPAPQNLASLVGGYGSDNSDDSDKSESQSADGDRG